VGSTTTLRLARPSALLDRVFADYGDDPLADLLTPELVPNW
jgi:hypothetical protein